MASPPFGWRGRPPAVLRSVLVGSITARAGFVKFRAHLVIARAHRARWRFFVFSFCLRRDTFFPWRKKVSKERHSRGKGFRFPFPLENPPSLKRPKREGRGPPSLETPTGGGCSAPAGDTSLCRVLTGMVYCMVGLYENEDGSYGIHSGRGV